MVCSAVLVSLFHLVRIYTGIHLDTFSYFGRLRPSFVAAAATIDLSCSSNVCLPFLFLLSFFNQRIFVFFSGCFGDVTQQRIGMYLLLLLLLFLFVATATTATTRSTCFYVPFVPFVQDVVRCLWLFCPHSMNSGSTIDWVVLFSFLMFFSVSAARRHTSMFAQRSGRPRFHRSRRALLPLFIGATTMQPTHWHRTTTVRHEIRDNPSVVIPFFLLLLCIVRMLINSVISATSPYLMFVVATLWWSSLCFCGGSVPLPKRRSSSSPLSPLSLILMGCLP